MVKKTFIIMVVVLLFSIDTHAIGNSNIEIFDIEKGCVVKNVESNTMILKEVKQYIEGIAGHFGKLNPIPPRGFMVKIFLEPEVSIKSPYLNCTVNEVILIFPRNDRPYFMVFDGNMSPVFFYSTGCYEKLLELLNYDPKFSDT